MIPPNSIDYCFTDPPYGDSIQYYELTKLWAGWLNLDTDSREEIIINPQQHKSEDYYFKMMREAFDQIYKVLKPEKYLTVTFHNTKVNIFNMIIRATEFAGFELEKIIYQKSGRAGAKALGQPYGSAIGDYYLRFKKPGIQKKLKLEPSISDEQYRRIVIDSIIKIIAERGEPTPYTFILNGIYPILNNYGYVVTDGKDIKKILESELGNEFVLVEDMKGLIQGKLWYFKDPSKSVPFLETIPLNDRVEKAVIQVLSNNMKISFDDILQFIYENFPNALTPDSANVMNILEEYGDKTKDGKWILKPSVKDALGIHDAIVEKLAMLGEIAGYSVYADIPKRRTTLKFDDINAANLGRIREIDVLWYTNGKIHYEFEVENSTIISEAIIRGSNIPYRIKRFVIIPKEREDFLSRKINEPALKDRITADNWGFMTYGDLEEFYTKSIKSKSIDLKKFEKLNKRPTAIRNTTMEEFVL